MGTINGTCRSARFDLQNTPRALDRNKERAGQRCPRNGNSACQLAATARVALNIDQDPRKTMFATRSPLRESLMVGFLRLTLVMGACSRGDKGRIPEISVEAAFS